MFKRCTSFGLAGEDGVPQLYEDIIGPFGILTGGDMGDAAVVQFQVDVIGAGMIGVGGVADRDVLDPVDGNQPRSEREETLFPVQEDGTV